MAIAGTVNNEPNVSKNARVRDFLKEKRFAFIKNIL
jgi:hypothetical protein